MGELVPLLTNAMTRPVPSIQPEPVFHIRSSITLTGNLKQVSESSAMLSASQSCGMLTKPIFPERPPRKRISEESQRLSMT